MTFSDLALLIPAGLLAGAMNAIAGGGTFVTFPALIALGLPPVAANATATLSALPGYFSGAAAFREDIANERRFPLWQLIATALVGGLCGALLLIATPSKAFAGAVPWLLLIATLLFALGPRLVAIMRARAGREAGLWTMVGVLGLVCLYGGYFNGGLGILLLAGLGLIGLSDLNAMNGLKNLMSGSIATISAVPFALAGVVHWPEGAAMAVATMLGAYGGGRLARRLPDQRLIRWGVIAIGLGMSALFFARA
ncbi:MAG: hypothetical protein CSA72_10225 [Rhodobacterales bacterium]|nr:MAG: hypothetical protein CSA72_10225 [Rhodobacterales bacterium]